MANLFRCAGGGEDIKCIERPYDISKTYNAGDTVLYNGLLRICTANGVTGDFNESKWEVTTLEELLGENAGESATFVDYIASEYDPTHTYAAGDAILGDNGEILKCLEDEVTGEFDNSKWSRDYLCNLSGNVNSNLGCNFDGILHCTSGNASTFYYVNDNMGASYSYQSAGSNLNCVDFTIKYTNPSWTLTALKKIKYSDNKNMENSQILNEGETLQWGYTEKKHYYIKIME